MRPQFGEEGVSKEWLDELIGKFGTPITIDGKEYPPPLDGAKLREEFRTFKFTF